MRRNLPNLFGNASAAASAIRPTRGCRSVAARIRGSRRCCGGCATSTGRGAVGRRRRALSQAGGAASGARDRNSKDLRYRGTPERRTTGVRAGAQRGGIAESTHPEEEEAVCKRIAKCEAWPTRCCCGAANPRLCPGRGGRGAGIESRYAARARARPIARGRYRPLGEAEAFYAAADIAFVGAECRKWWTHCWSRRHRVPRRPHTSTSGDQRLMLATERWNACDGDSWDGGRAWLRAPKRAWRGEAGASAWAERGIGET